MKTDARSTAPAPVIIDQRTVGPRAMGQPGIFAPGMLTMGLAARMLTDFVGDGRLSRYTARFLGQVWPGDTLSATATVTAIRIEPDEQGDEVRFADMTLFTENQRGDTSGKALVCDPVQRAGISRFN